MMRRLIAAILLGLLAVAPTFAADAASSPDAVRQAAEAGNANAQLNLGILYEYGFHMKGNKVEALAWYIAAADQGLPKAAQYRDKLMHELTAAQVQQAREKAKKIPRAPKATPPSEAAPPAAPVPQGQSAPLVPEAQSVPPVPQVLPAPAGPSSDSGDSEGSPPVPTVQTAPAP
jgi:hypothetical protein